jgi:hypothetical protein
LVATSPGGSNNLSFPDRLSHTAKDDGHFVLSGFYAIHAGFPFLSER